MFQTLLPEGTSVAAAHPRQIQRLTSGVRELELDAGQNECELMIVLFQMQIQKTKYIIQNTKSKQLVMLRGNCEMR